MFVTLFDHDTCTDSQCRTVYETDIDITHQKYSVKLSNVFEAVNVHTSPPQVPISPIFLAIYISLWSSTHGSADYWSGNSAPKLPAARILSLAHLFYAYFTNGPNTSTSAQYDNTRGAWLTQEGYIGPIERKEGTASNVCTTDA